MSPNDSTALVLQGFIVVYTLSLLVKRAVLGPRPKFAGACCLLYLTAILMLAMAQHQGAPLFTMGMGFLQAALLLTFWMFGSEVLWIVRHGRRPWR